MRTRVRYEGFELVDYELLPPGPPGLPADEETLRGLVGRAFGRRADELRGAVAAIVEWFELRHVRALERRERSTAAVRQALRAPSSSAKAWEGEEPPILTRV